jgi:hypothetical protein
MGDGPSVSHEWVQSSTHDSLELAFVAFATAATYAGVIKLHSATASRLSMAFSKATAPWDGVDAPSGSNADAGELLLVADGAGLVVDVATSGFDPSPAFVPQPASTNKDASTTKTSDGIR